ncbi:hypothetical protein FMN50_08425 [Rhodobacterales bacterium]|nr:hypothetical protein FMN50_08425 [Rhodobacterales bacterium]
MERPRPERSACASCGGNPGRACCPDRRTPIGTDFSDANDQPSARDVARQWPGIRATEALTAKETIVSRIRVQLLISGAVGRNTIFSELGGHQLVATRVVGRLLTELSLELPVRTLFDKSALSDLAAHIDGMQLEAENPAGSECSPVSACNNAAVQPSLVEPSSRSARLAPSSFGDHQARTYMIGPHT